MQLQSRPGTTDSGQVPHAAIALWYVLVLSCEVVTKEAMTVPLQRTPSPGHLVVVRPCLPCVSEVCQWI